MRKFAGLLVAGWFALSIAACTDNLGALLNGGSGSLDSVLHHKRDSLVNLLDSSRRDDSTRHNGRDTTEIRHNGRDTTDIRHDGRDSTNHDLRDTTEIRHGGDDSTHHDGGGEANDSTHHGGGGDDGGHRGGHH